MNHHGADGTVHDGPGGIFYCNRCEALNAVVAASEARVLPELRWAPYQEFGTPDPELETHEPPAFPVMVGATGYTGNKITVYWETEQERFARLEVGRIPPTEENTRPRGWAENIAPDCGDPDCKEQKHEQQ